MYSLFAWTERDINLDKRKKVKRERRIHRKKWRVGGVNKRQNVREEKSLGGEEKRRVVRVGRGNKR